MSLTSIIRRPYFRARFLEEFEKPQRKITSTMLAPPICEHPVLVGTAYDYILRFMLQKKYSYRTLSRYVAEDGLRRLYPFGQKVIGYRILSNALTNLNAYLKTGKLEQNLLRSALRLAQLDIVYRAGIHDDKLGQVSKADLLDLNNVVNVTNLKLFKPKKFGVLNPIFGRASRLVGGADADIIVDDCLIEIKTTKTPHFDRETFNQLIGYYVLSLIGGIIPSPDKVKIRYLAAYYSRCAQLVSFRIDEIASASKMKKFTNWFRKQIED